MNLKVLVADDSSFQRKILTEMLSTHKDIDYVLLARNGEEAIKIIEDKNPDVLILDLNMPQMDGVETFKYLSNHYPIPTIIFSSTDPSTLTEEVQSLLLGAVDYITKPSGVWKEEFPKLRDEIISKVLLAAKLKKSSGKRHSIFKEVFKKHSRVTEPEVPSKEIIADKSAHLRSEYYIEKLFHKEKVTNSNVVLMGSSTGGPKTLKFILKEIPENFPLPILIVQHLDEYFMQIFARSLNDICKVNVKIAEDGEIIRGNQIYLAPGNKHMEIVKRGSEFAIRVFYGEKVHFCIPSVDVLFFSAAKTYMSKTMAILLTGMGEDGAAGLLAIKNVGGNTISESKETCILYGMPKAAAEKGAAKYIIPSYEVKDYVVKYANSIVGLI